MEGLFTAEDGKTRCSWCKGSKLYMDYHDNEWGKPVYDDIRLFEKICLEGFQAGLSWITVLKKRENFRAAFADFDFNKVALFTEEDVEILLQNKGIIRHRKKIESTINNAQRAIEMVEEFGSISDYLWRFKPDESSRPTVFTYEVLMKITQTAESKALSKDLKKRGWSFVGPTTMYAMMQAMGMVNDHIEGCDFR
ncbi:MAG: DNA-3-methyladenine glycosylase I [Bacteroidota bacterium]